MMKRIRHQRSYFAKAIDVFEVLPDKHRVGVLAAIVEEVGSEKWERKLKDPMMHRDLITDILFYFSGSPEHRQPDKNVLVRHILNYVKSSDFKENDKTVVYDAPFLDAIGEME